MNDYNIGGLMEEMELKLISSMKRNLQRHLKEESEIGFAFSQWQAMKLKELKKYQRENRDIIDGYTKGLDKDISRHLKRELTQGSIKSINQYNEVMGDKLKASKMLNNSFFKTDDRKVNALIKAVNNDLNTVTASALRMINDEYRQVIHKSAFFLANGTVSPKQAIDMATKEFLSRGLNCIEYKNGRRVNIASYSEMAVRTASLRAQLMGDGDFRKSIGRTLVIGVASNEACPLCTKWENKVMIDDVYSGGSKSDGDYTLLSEAMRQGFLHPNCRDGVATYYSELENIEKSYENGKDGRESDQAYRDDLNYINQQIKKYTRLETGSLDKNNIKTYRGKRLFYEDKKDTLIKQIATKEIVDKVYQIVDTVIINRTSGVKIVRKSSKGSQIELSKNLITLGSNANEYNLIHELGHKLQSNFTKEENDLYSKILKKKFSKYTKKDFEKILSSGDKYYWRLKDSSDFVSSYQTRVYRGGFHINGKIKLEYAQEYFSEGLKYYYKNPKMLKDKDELLYTFIEELIKNGG